MAVSSAKKHFLNLNPSEIYSTDEIVIGVWTDGKPFYQKTITGKIPSGAGSNKVLVSNFTNKTLRNVKGALIQKSGNYPVPIQFTASENNMAIVWQDGSSIKIMIADNDGLTSVNVGADYTIALQYTKTTD